MLVVKILLILAIIFVVLFLLSLIIYFFNLDMGGDDDYEGWVSNDGARYDWKKKKRTKNSD